MAYEVGLAETDEQKEAVYRFRYTVYVEEMGRYQGSADHAGRRLVEPEDDQWNSSTPASMTVRSSAPPG